MEITPKTTKARIQEFRESLNQSLIYEEIQSIDRWVDLSAKIVQLILLIITVLTAIPVLMMEPIPVSLLVLISALFVTLIFEIGYKFAIIKQAIDIRIQMVTFAIFMLYHTIVFGTIAYISLYILIENVLVTLFGFIIMIVGYRYLSTQIASFLSLRISNAIDDSMKPFGVVIRSLSLHLYDRAKTASVTIGGMLIFLLVLPIKIENEFVLPIVLFLISFCIVIIINFLRDGSSFISSLDLFWEFGDENLVIDLMSYCVAVRKRLQELDIEYEIQFNWRKCVKRTDIESLFFIDQIICTYPISPKGFEEVNVITLAKRKPNLKKLQILLNEDWSNGITLALSTLISLRSDDVRLGINPPFVNLRGRIIIDDSVLEREAVAWISGKPCFGIIFDSKDLLKLSDFIANCCE